MSSKNAIALLGILQTHGLSVELLQLLVTHCETKQTGGVSLYTSRGRFIKYEVRSCGAVVVEDERSGTGSDKMPYLTKL